MFKKPNKLPVEKVEDIPLVDRLESLINQIKGLDIGDNEKYGCIMYNNYFIGTVYYKSKELDISQVDPEFRNKKQVQDIYKQIKEIGFHINVGKFTQDTSHLKEEYINN